MTAPTSWRDVPLSLSLQDAARVLGVSRSTVYEAVRTNRLPARRIGIQYRISKHALLRWLNHRLERDERAGCWVETGVKTPRPGA